MLKITVYNETETDRNTIVHLLSDVVVKGDVFFEEIPVYDTVMFLSETHAILKLQCNDILYFEYINRKIKIVTEQEEYVCINEKINEIAKKMKAYGFAMSHQSFVVNLDKIEKVKSQELIMKNGDKVYLAQKRASTIRKELRSQRGKILI